MPLTPEEINFCDHLDYENFHCPEGKMPVPACNWMTAHGLPQQDIWNILMIRRWVRKDVMAPPEPPEPYAPAWKTGEEAKRRNQELAAEFKVAEELYQESVEARKRDQERAKEVEEDQSDENAHGENDNSP